MKLATIRQTHGTAVAVDTGSGWKRLAGFVDCDVSRHR